MHIEMNDILIQIPNNYDDNMFKIIKGVKTRRLLNLLQLINI